MKGACANRSIWKWKMNRYSSVVFLEATLGICDGGLSGDGSPVECHDTFLSSRFQRTRHTPINSCPKMANVDVDLPIDKWVLLRKTGCQAAVRDHCCMWT